MGVFVSLIIQLISVPRGVVRRLFCPGADGHGHVPGSRYPAPVDVGGYRAQNIDLHVGASRLFRDPERDPTACRCAKL